MTTVFIPVAYGELIDKITILEIKSERLQDPGKLANVRTELEMLGKIVDDSRLASNEVIRLQAELKAVNIRLWDLEDAVRDCERAGDFGDEFIRIARAIYRTNDERAAFKRDINMHVGSHIVEEKSYADY